MWHIWFLTNRAIDPIACVVRLLICSFVIHAPPHATGGWLVLLCHVSNVHGTSDTLSIYGWANESHSDLLTIYHTIFQSPTPNVSMWDDCVDLIRRRENSNDVECTKCEYIFLSWMECNLQIPSRVGESGQEECIHNKYMDWIAIYDKCDNAINYWIQYWLQCNHFEQKI